MHLVPATRGFVRRLTEFRLAELTYYPETLGIVPGGRLYSLSLTISLRHSLVRRSDLRICPDVIDQAIKELKTSQSCDKAF